MINAAVVLLDDLDNPAAARFDQNSAAIHNRITIVTSAVFRRYLVIADAFLRQNRANSDLLAILIGRATLLDNVGMKAGAFIDAENPGDSTDHAANDAADDGTDGTGGSFAISGASLNPTGDPLGPCRNRERHCGDKGSNSDKTADHDISDGMGRCEYK